MAKIPSLLERFEAICEEQPRALRARYENVKESRSWTIGRQKTFAAWSLRGDQVGPHVRCNDDVVRGDSARVKTTTATTRGMEKKNNFVWLDPSADWTDEELKTLIVASHALAERKDGGIKRGGEFADLFIAVRKALVAVPPEMRPPGPYHAGGPAAKILTNEGPSSRALALWAAKQLTPYCPEEEREQFDRAMELAAAERAKYDALWAAAYKKDGSPALKGARYAQLAHGSMAGGYETRASSYAADIIVLLIGELLRSGGVGGAKAAEKIKALIAEVDDRVLNAEFAAVAHAKLERDDVVCERVLWRATDAKGNANRWVARMTPKTYAMIAKLGPRWEWIEGTRDDVLATVPDHEMEAATKIAFARDVPGQFGEGAFVPNPRWERAKKKKNKK